jgi:hypothetical protein
MLCIQRCLLYVNYYSAGFRRQNKTVWLSISTAIVTLYFLLSSPTEFGNNFFQTKDAAASTISNNNSNNHPPILYGHIHVAKTGGTSLNGILANKLITFVVTKDIPTMHIKIMNAQNKREL